MQIDRSDRRPLSEQHPAEVCGCGRTVRYISTTNGDNACNKYGRCMSWDELKAKHEELRKAATAFADEPLDRNTYTLDHTKRKRLLDVLTHQSSSRLSEGGHDD